MPYRRASSARSAGKALRMIFVSTLLNGGDAQLTPTGGAGGTAGLVADLGHFIPGLRGIIHISLELGGRGMRGSGGQVERNALIELRHPYL